MNRCRRQNLLLIRAATLIGLCLPYIVSCSFYDGAFHQIDGRFFDYRNIDEIVDGETTEQEIIQWFGPPVSISDTDAGSKVLRYYSVRSRRSVAKRFFFTKVYIQNVEQELVVKISSGVVVSHNYTRLVTEV